MPRNHALFHRRLKQLREATGLTQKELAERAGLHPIGVSQLEIGRRGPTWESACRLADALGVSLDAFAREDSA